MLHYARILLFLAALLFSLASCDVFGSDDGGGGPYLYLGNWDQDEVFVVDMRTNRVIKTLEGFDDSVWTLALSEDGRTLYVGTQRSGLKRDSNGRFIPNSWFMTGALYAVDTHSWRKRKLLDKPVDVYAGPPGRIAFVEYTFGEVGQPVGLVDTRTHAVTFLDTLDVRERGTSGLSRQGLVFHPSRPIFYTGDSLDRLFAYDYERKEVVHTYGSTGGFYLTNMTISPDGRRMYMAGGPVLDLEQDVVTGWVGGNHLSSVALSPSGDSLYVTDPGGYLNIEIIPSEKIFIFDTRSYRYVGEVGIDVDKAAFSLAGILTDTIVLSPDGRTAYVSNFGALVFVIDVAAEKVVDVIQPRERDIQLVPLAMGAKP
jgi:DNA-binding beta-propeller fold protein YncE